MKPRVGLFFCRCGPNLGQVVDLEALSAPARWPAAEVVDVHPVLCSEEGRGWLAQRIREEGLERVVLAACSPKEHESTFQCVLRDAGLNGFMLQMANIREQCEWAGGGREEATAKASGLVRAALARAPLHEALATKEVDCSPDVLVIGSGVAGLSAALTLAQKKRKVFLVEREHALGGRVALLDEVYPGMECASCFLEPALDRVLHDDGIQVLTGAEVSRVLGSFGDYRVTVSRRPRRVDPDLCLGCGACAEACPVETPDPASGMLGVRKAIYMPFPGCLPHVSAVDESLCLHVLDGSCSACEGACPFSAIRLDQPAEETVVACGALVVATGSESAQPGFSGDERVLTCFQLERLLHPNGPTAGKLAPADLAPPSRFLFALTEGGVGDGPLAWRELLKLARRVCDALPGARATLAGGPEHPLGPERELADSLRGDGALFLPGTLVRTEAGGGAAGGVVATLHDGEASEKVEADRVVFYPLSRPSRGAAQLATLLHLRAETDGYFRDRAGAFETASTGVEGIYVAGCAGGPRTISESIHDGAAAAARVLSKLVPGEKVTLEAVVSEVDPDRCGGCGVCAACCPYGAVGMAPEGRSFHVEPALCRGCGTCAAACPSQAVTARHYTSPQILAELEALLHPGDAAPATGG